MKANVFKIQASDKSVTNKLKVPINESKIKKLFKISIPRKIPLNKDSKTLRVRSAKIIAIREGKSERYDGSMVKTLFPIKLNHFYQIFLDKGHILYFLLL